MGHVARRHEQCLWNMQQLVVKIFNVPCIQVVCRLVGFGDADQGSGNPADKDVLSRPNSLARFQ